MKIFLPLLAVLLWSGCTKAPDVKQLSKNYQIVINGEVYTPGNNGIAAWTKDNNGVESFDIAMSSPAGNTIGLNVIYIPSTTSLQVLGTGPELSDVDATSNGLAADPGNCVVMVTYSRSEEVFGTGYSTGFSSKRGSTVSYTQNGNIHEFLFSGTTLWGFKSLGNGNFDYATISIQGQAGDRTQ